MQQNITDSEHLLADYFASLGYKAGSDFLYEVVDLSKPTRPDFRFDGLGLVFDIKEFDGSGKEDQKLLRGNTAQPIDGNQGVRSKIDQFSKQVKPYKEEYSCNLVLYRAGGLAANLETFALASALFGDERLSFPKEGESATLIYKGNAKLQANKNTRIASVSILEITNPGVTRAHARYKELYKDQMPAGHFLEFIRAYDIFDQPDIIRLRTILNPYASKPIPSSFFAGKNDEVYSVDLATGKMERLDTSKG